MIYSGFRKLRFTLMLMIGACGDPTSPLDTTGPIIVIRAPHAGSVDADRDGLVDFRIEWPRKENIERDRILVTNLRAENASAINLLTVWNVSELSDTALVLHETTDYLLPPGTNRIQISISDTAGNATVDTIEFVTRALQLVDTLSSGHPPSLHRGTDLIICPNGRGYVTAGTTLLVFDPQAISLIGDYPVSFIIDPLHQMACVPGDNRLYVTEPIHRFDMAASAWTTQVVNTFGADAIRPSRQNLNWLYVGEADGGIAVFDRATQTRLHSLGIAEPPDHDDRIYGMAVMPNDTKIYITRVDEGGILVVDPARAEIVRRIKVSGSWTYYGRVDDLVLSPDGGLLYAAVIDGEHRGVAVISTQTDEIVHFYELDSILPQMLALSPSGNRLFVTSNSLTTQSNAFNVLIDLPTRQILETSPNYKPAGVSRNDGPTAFRGDGKYIFVGRDRDIDVYLHRE